MFWALFLIVAALISIAVLNPIPVIAALILMAIGRKVEAPYIEVIEAAGRNPDLPRPTSGPGCLAFLIAVIMFGFLAIVALGAVGSILGGL